jgi:hypothetical protein
MSTLLPTRHGAVRMAQRGFNVSDVELIAMVGTEVEDGYLVRHADYQEIERILKRFLERLRTPAWKETGRWNRKNCDGLSCYEQPSTSPLTQFACGQFIRIARNRMVALSYPPSARR